MPGPDWAVRTVSELAALPDDFPTPSGGLDFDKAEMKKLFEKGFAFGSKATEWKAVAAEAGPGASDGIRTGTAFQRVK